MGILEHDNVVWTIFMQIGAVLGVAVAAWRILYRYRWMDLWFDDYLVGVAAVGCTSMFIIIAIASGKPSGHMLALCLWASLNIKAILICSTRLETLMSIARLYRMRRRKVYTMHILAGIIFLLGFPPVMILSNYPCARDLSWLKNDDPVCPFTISQYLSSFAIEFIVDFLLSLSPLHISKNLTSKKETFVVAASYSSPIWVLITNLFVAVFVFRTRHLGPRILLLLMNITVIIRVFSCNIGIIAGYIHRGAEPPRQPQTTEENNTQDNPDADADAAQESTIGWHEMLRAQELTSPTQNDSSRS